MEKRYGEDRIKGTDTVSEPEVAYAHCSRGDRTRKRIPQPDGVNQSMEESAAAWRRQIDEFIAESNRIYETGDTAARKDLTRRMEAFIREKGGDYTLEDINLHFGNVANCGGNDYLALLRELIDRGSVPPYKVK